MIKFACHCGHVLEYPEDMAGRQVQCPHCQRLVDVPTTDELSQLDEDGTFRIDEPVQNETGRFEKLQRVYAREKVDEQGEDIDLRQTREEIAAAGTHDDVFEYERNPKAPKYDPETGELIKPLDIVEDPETAHPAEIPNAGNLLNYATPSLAGDLPYSPLARLIEPINLAAMFFVFLCQLFFYLAAFSLFLTIAALIFIGPALIAHYANVVEEIGIEERDELPRFLRHFNFVDDIWLPFARVFLAWMVCFGPATVLSSFWAAESWPPVPGIVVVSILDLLGLAFFPAVVLTTTTSGSFLNLRPDRLLAVIALIGPRYALLPILYFVAISIYWVGFLTVPVHAFFFLRMKHPPSFLFGGPVAYGSLIAGIFLMHWFAWLLGLHYRRLHSKFPWVYHQRERYIPGVTARRYARPAARRLPARPPQS